MALVGYELEKQKIEAKIQEIRSQLGGRNSGTRAGGSAKLAGGAKRRTLSVSARRRIAAAKPLAQAVERHCEVIGAARAVVDRIRLHQKSGAAKGPHGPRHVAC